MASKISLPLLGVPGLKMPALGLGTWQSTNEDELASSLDSALELGYRHIDTAYAYTNEKIIGNVLKKWLDSGKLQREDLFITTKLPIVGVNPDRVELFMKKSLEALQLDHVDLYLIHSPIGAAYKEGLVFPEPNTWESNTDHLAIWKKMEEQVDLGRTKTIGISNFNLRQTKRIFENSRIKPASLQVELHVYFQQKELVKYCQDNGIVVVAYSPLGSPGTDKFFKALVGRELKMPDMLNDETVKKLASKYKKTSAQILLRFLVQKNIVAIPKSVKVGRLKENIDIFDFSLTVQDMTVLESLDLGDSGRIFNLSDIYPELKNHPENPRKP